MADEEREVRGLMDFARNLAIGFIRRDEGREGDDAAVGKQLRHLAHTADVLRTVCAIGEHGMETDEMRIEDLGLLHR